MSVSGRGLAAVAGLAVGVGALAVLAEQKQPKPAGGGGGGVSPAGFLSAHGINLMLDGKPYHQIGDAQYRLTSTQAGFNCGGYYTDAQLAQLLDMLVQNRIRVVRTWCFANYGFAQIDRLVAACKQRGIKIIAVLTNQWIQCQPRPATATQYISLGNGHGYRNRAWYESGYTQPDVAGQMPFSQWAVAFAQRYRNEPTIGIIQLVNEAEAADVFHGVCNASAAASALRTFADTIGAAIRKVDPNHLISLGTMGGSQCGMQGFLTIHSSPYIDLCEFHDYTGTTALPGEFSIDMRDAVQLGKPLICGEVGCGLGNAGMATQQQRAAVYQAKLAAQFGAGLAIWCPWEIGLAASGGYGIGPGDPALSTFAQFQAQLDAKDGR